MTNENPRDGRAAKSNTPIDVDKIGEELEMRIREDRAQLLDSDLRRGASPKDGFVAVTRFAREAVTMLDFVPAERDHA